MLIDTFFHLKLNKIKKLSIFSLLLTQNCLAMESNEGKFQFDAQKINRVEMKVDCSDITIHSSIYDNISEVCYKKISMGRDPRFNIFLEEDTLKIEARKFEGDSHTFETSFDINIPPQASVSVCMGSGSFSIKESEGKVDLSVGKIKANIKSPLSELIIKAGSGNLNIEGVEGDIKLNLGSGSSNIKYWKTFDYTRNLKLGIGSGNSNIYLPSSSSVKVTCPTTFFISSMVNEFSDFSHIENPNFNIKASIGTGKLSVKKNDE